MPTPPGPPDASQFTVNLLDVGWVKFGDCILCRYGNLTVLIDGGHPGDYRSKGDYPSIPDQLEELLGIPPPFHVSLLVVTHVHADHIGCLPRLILDETLSAEWALVADEKLGFPVPFHDADGELFDVADMAPPAVRRLVAALREERVVDGASDALIRDFLADAEALESQYKRMLKTLKGWGSGTYRIILIIRECRRSLRSRRPDFCGFFVPNQSSMAPAGPPAGLDGPSRSRFTTSRART